MWWNSLHSPGWTKQQHSKVWHHTGQCSPNDGYPVLQLVIHLLHHLQSVQYLIKAYRYLSNTTSAIKGCRYRNPWWVDTLQPRAGILNFTSHILYCCWAKGSYIDPACQILNLCSVCVTLKVPTLKMSAIHLLLEWCLPRRSGPRCCGLCWGSSQTAVYRRTLRCSQEGTVREISTVMEDYQVGERHHLVCTQLSGAALARCCPWRVLLVGRF